VTKPTTHNHRVRIAALVAMLLAAVAVLTACTGSSGDSVSGGNQVASTEYSRFTTAVPYPFANAAPSDPLERKNLAFRLQQYNSKGSTNYVYVFTFSGQVVGYYVIQGKVSSTGSQMTSTQITSSCGQNCGLAVDSIGDDGSYGPSEGGQFGVFFRTAGGALVETDLPFLVSNAPIPTYANIPQLQK
jgi:hypothetical protein